MQYCSKRVAISILGLLGCLAVPRLVTAQPVPATAPSTSQRAAAQSEASELFSRTSPAVVSIITQDKNGKDLSLGSGFYVSDDGLIVTNQHVIQLARAAKVVQADGKALSVTGVAAVDPGYDLAVIKVDAKPTAKLALASETDAQVGMRVWVIGNPQGFTNTISEGLVSGIRTRPGDRREIQTSAAVSHGSSGGPMLAADGKVIGVITSSVESGQQLNFGVPAEAVAKLLARSDASELMTFAEAGKQTLTPTKEPTLEVARKLAQMGLIKPAFKILNDLEPQTNTQAEYWYTLAMVHSCVPNHTITLQSVEKALAIKPDYADALELAADCHATAKRYAKAIELYHRVASLGQKDVSLYIKAAICYKELRDFSRAEQFARHAIKLDEKTPRAYLILAYILDAEGHTRDALDILSGVVARNPAEGEVYLAIGAMEVKLGKSADGRKSLQKAITVDPMGRSASVAKSMIADLDRRQRSLPIQAGATADTR